MISFDVTAGGASGPRCGRLTTGHGAVETPVFMPVGTHGSVKACSTEDLVEHKVGMILANTYHLYLRPGHEAVHALGGLHRFMSWPGPILTDSGGYQVLSLGALRTLSDEGVLFRSHLDGSMHLLTPEKATEVQELLGADIAMALDVCIAFPYTRAAAKAAMERTLDWAKRCRESSREGSPALFGIVQGGVFPELRSACAKALAELDFSGYALGGLGVGEEKEATFSTVERTVECLPPHAPRYLMGMGTPEDLVEAVALGIDMFDCVLPTRNARNGTLFTRFGRIHIRNSRYALDERPIEPGCGCSTCRSYSRAYLRHLFLSRELSVYRFNSIHNLFYYQDLMERMREAIRNDLFAAFRREFLENLTRVEEDEPEALEAGPRAGIDDSRRSWIDDNSSRKEV
ncbi:MAG: tRNA guanosine(34) transglycosylase Tgt [bacterium]